jgi:hypothetical protein
MVIGQVANAYELIAVDQRPRWLLSEAGELQMKKVVLVGIALACSAAVTAADIDTRIAVKAAGDFDTLSAQCIGLESGGMKRCLQIIARHKFAPLHNLNQLTLAEKTAIDAIMAADPKAILVVLPDGSFVIGHDYGDRFVYIPCEATPCPGR